MNKNKTLFLALFCLPFGTIGTSPQNHHSVVDYQTSFEACTTKDHQNVYLLRSFELDGRPAHLVIDPQNLQTHILATDCLDQCQPASPEDLVTSPYHSLLSEALNGPHPLENDGVTHGTKNTPKLSLTIDMCPSKKGISQKVYDKLVALAQQNNEAFPVGIAMTKRWMERYPRSFAWIKEQQLSGLLKIVWINHSATHPYSPHVANSHNFLLTPGVHFDDEVLLNEQALIAAGVTPSVFFRFPGLISSKNLVDQLTHWGLIALGSNAWLAKGQKPTNGSVLLIHGNQNEPAGEKIFLNYVEKKSADIAWASITDLLAGLP